MRTKSLEELLLEMQLNNAMIAGDEEKFERLCAELEELKRRS